MAGPIVVRGKIREGSATSLCQVNVSDDLPSSGLVLDCDGERVELTGAITRASQAISRTRRSGRRSSIVVLADRQKLTALLFWAD